MKTDSGKLSARERDEILNKIPIFLAKTYRMVDNSDYKDIISWAPDGDSFVVKNISRLTTEVFPQHFKHNNFLSFIRQLNMYGFHKLVTNSENDGAVFHHEHFKRDDMQRLLLIKRKNTVEESENQQQIVAIPSREQRLQQEVSLLRSQHEQLQSMMEVLMEQNKTITAQNKAFLDVMGDMRQKYRKKLQTLMLLFLFGKKTKPDGDFILPPQLNNVIREFEERNVAMGIYPRRKRRSNQLMITQGSPSHRDVDSQRSQLASNADKEDSQEIFKVLEPIKRNMSSEGMKNDQEEKIQGEHHDIDWKDGFPVSPLSVSSRPQKIKNSSDWEEYLNRLENSDYSEIELEKNQ